MAAGAWIVVVAVVMTTVVAVALVGRRRPPITLWFEVSAGRDLVVHATNTGRRPVAIDVVGLRGPPWRRSDRVVALPTTTAQPAPRSTVDPGASTSRTLAKEVLEWHVNDGREWVYAGSACGAGRSRRIPAALTRHVLWAGQGQ